MRYYIQVVTVANGIECEIVSGVRPQERIGRLFVHEEAYRRIRTWIIEGQLAPGTRLRDKEFAEAFGVSRTPVRESFLRLEQEGLVITQPNRSTVVSWLDWSGVVQRYPLIWTLERYAVTSAPVEAWDCSLLQELAEYNCRLDEAVTRQDAAAAARADEAFHAALVATARNLELQRILSELKTQLMRVEIAHFHEVFSQRSADEHTEILEGLKIRDVERVARAVESNWRQSFVRIQQLVADHPSEEANTAKDKDRGQVQSDPVRRLARDF